MTVQNRLELCGTMDAGFEHVLTPAALEFLGELERRFGPRRRRLLQARAMRRARLISGEMPGLLSEATGIREGDWTVAAPPPHMRQRWVEITAPTDRKVMIDALTALA